MLPALTFLVVDRDEDGFRDLRAALRRAIPGCRVQWAHDGADACAYLAGEDGYGDRAFFPLPHLIVANLWKPGATDLQFLRVVRADAAHHSIPAIAFSGSYDEVCAVEARTLGLTHYHRRPLGAEALADLLAAEVRELLRSPQTPFQCDETGRRAA